MPGERRALAAGIAVSLAGLLCLGAGIALLAWRILQPEKAVILPPDVVFVTPTPGVLGQPIAPPPLLEEPLQVAILPVSDPPTPTPSPFHVTTTSTGSPTATASPTQTLIPAASSTGTPTPAQPVTQMAAVPTSTPQPKLPPTVPDRIIIETIGLNAPVVPVGQHALEIDGQLYSQWDVPNTRAVGWHQNSAALGEPGNLVLNGHHNVYGEVFRWLVTLKPGDVINLEGEGERYRYVVVQTMTLAEEGQPLATRQANARWILPTMDERVTLITCWPYHTNTHRLVVIALPVDRPVEIP